MQDVWKGKQEEIRRMLPSFAAAANHRKEPISGVRVAPKSGRRWCHVRLRRETKVAFTRQWGVPMAQNKYRVTNPLRMAMLDGEAKNRVEIIPLERSQHTSKSLRNLPTCASCVSFFEGRLLGLWGDQKETQLVGGPPILRPTREIRAKYARIHLQMKF